MIYSDNRFIPEYHLAELRSINSKIYDSERIISDSKALIIKAKAMQLSALLEDDYIKDARATIMIRNCESLIREHEAKINSYHRRKLDIIYQRRSY